jgi:hypothetical protein
VEYTCNIERSVSKFESKKAVILVSQTQRHPLIAPARQAIAAPTICGMDISSTSVQVRAGRGGAAWMVEKRETRTMRFPRRKAPSFP